VTPRQIGDHLEMVMRGLALTGNITISFTYDGKLAPLLYALRVYRNGEQVIGWEKHCADAGEPQITDGPMRLARIEIRDADLDEEKS
jgi:hypothetical protein